MSEGPKSYYKRSFHNCVATHLSGMDTQDRDTCLRTRRRKLDLTVDTPWPEKGTVQDVDAVGGHDDLYVLCSFKAVELVEQFEHCPLDLRVSAAAPALPTRRANAVNLVHEDDRRRMLACHDE